MTIETKYNVGDKVYILDGSNNVTSGEILNIKVAASKENISINYNISNRYERYELATYSTPNEAKAAWILKQKI